MAATRAQLRKQFIADALKARDEFMRTGEAYALDDIRRYYTARLSGTTAKRPRVRRYDRRRERWQN
jgi:hypothetical protein